MISENPLLVSRYESFVTGLHEQREYDDMDNVEVEPQADGLEDLEAEMDEHKAEYEE